MEHLEYIFTAIVSAIGGFILAYATRKGKNYAEKEDFEQILNQLKETTRMVESVKIAVTNRSWITQQVWVKKQEAYEEIFKSLASIKQYVVHVTQERWDYQYVHYLYELSYDDPEEMEAEYKYYQECSSRLESEEETKLRAELKTKSDKAVNKIFDQLICSAIYLTPEVNTQLLELRHLVENECSENDEERFYMESENKFDEIFNNIKKLALKELEFE
ncbi:hypothetical protein [Vibrio sp. 1151_11]|uniref:hypothetical protein n=1 Tax=Vibrio sp. 1151_11 TaxID=2527670 RepID=UPI0024054BC5|nr:hypothetical protein [Vibrio sp. 1151_11]